MEITSSVKTIDFETYLVRTTCSSDNRCFAKNYTFKHCVIGRQNPRQVKAICFAVSDHIKDVVSGFMAMVYGTAVPFDCEQHHPIVRKTPGLGNGSKTIK